MRTRRAMKERPRVYTTTFLVFLDRIMTSAESLDNTTSERMDWMRKQIWILQLISPFFGLMMDRAAQGKVMTGHESFIFHSFPKRAKDWSSWDEKLRG